MKIPTRPAGWRYALTVLLGAQLLFWSAYALIFYSMRPHHALDADRLTAGRLTPEPGDGPMGAYVHGLSEPALLHIPGWQPAVVYPARASLLLRAPADEAEVKTEVKAGAKWSLGCLKYFCAMTWEAVYAGPLERMDKAAGLERFQRYDMVWTAIAVVLVVGAALLVLLPISRFSRLQTVTGIFLILVAPDAWLTSFGALELPYAWFLLLFYGVKFLLLTSMSMMVNAFAGWHVREAWATSAGYAVALAILIGTLLTGGNLAKVLPLLEAAVLILVSGHGLLAGLRLFRSAPGLAFRGLAVLFVALAAAGFDMFLLPPPPRFMVQAAVLSPPLLIFVFLFELALQGRQLERLLAINAERQRLLRDMHDGAGGVLTHLLLDIRENRLTRSDVEQGLQSAVDDLRNMASAIDAGNEPIDEALAMFRERVAVRLSRSGITFDYHCVLPAPAPSLDARRLLNLYRLLQEGIANALRHAQATHIDLTLEAAGDDAILIKLSDNGTGFDPMSASGSPGEGRGLMNMRRRASQMGGHLRIEGAAKLGTRIILTVPVSTAGK